MTESNASHRRFTQPSQAPRFAVVMAGGAGSRLWPESRRARPKPFLPLADAGRSLLRATFDRLDALVPLENRLVVVGEAFADAARDELPELPSENLLAEPIGRDTAACVAWSAVEIARREPDALAIVLPSDHLVRPVEPFCDAVARAARIVDAQTDRIALLGVAPTAPSTAYGYVERGQPLADEPFAREVASFREKPDAATARRFLETGRFYWNAGVFVWRARRILTLLSKYEPTFAEFIARVDALGRDSSADERSRREALRAAFSSVKKISIDRAVLERASNVVVSECRDFCWSDLGSFAALEETSAQLRDADGNLAIGRRLLARDAQNVFVRASDASEKLVVVSGVNDLLIVDAGDALLVAKKGDDAALREIVERLKEQGLERFL